MAKINSYRKNNTNGLQYQISGLLAKSELWLVLRIDEAGIHLHTPNESHLCLLAEFLSNSPELLEMVNEYAKDKNAKK